MTMEVHRPRTFLRRLERGLVGLAMVVLGSMLAGLTMALGG